MESTDYWADRKKGVRIATFYPFAKTYDITNTCSTRK